jgi:hypothetical protein
MELLQQIKTDAFSERESFPARCFSTESGRDLAWSGYGFAEPPPFVPGAAPPLIELGAVVAIGEGAEPIALVGFPPGTSEPGEAAALPAEGIG